MAAKQEFESRFAKHKDELEWLFMELYHNREGLEVLEREMAEAYNARSAELKALDKARSADPEWYKRGNMFGMTMYTDLFAGNLKELAKKLPYLKEQKLTYLHLMPLLQMPHPHNDGGYAVEDFDTVDPALGTNKDLENLTRELRKAGISLCLDFVMNHTASTHRWAMAAKAGDPWFQAYYHLYEDRTIPDQYEQTVPQVFPNTAPGNFTWCEEMHKWVLTTFHDYQWDLNYANPAVFVDMTKSILHLANLGVEVFRIDAVPYIWKQLGTTCRNLPQVQNMELFDWLKTLYEIWKNLDEDVIRLSSLTGMGELMKHGCTTCFDHHYVFPTHAGDLIGAQFAAADTLGIRMYASRGSMDLSVKDGGLPPDSVVQTVDEIMTDSARLIEKYHDTSYGAMHRIALAPCSPFSVSAELLRQSAILARQYGVRLHTHLCETKDEENFMLQREGIRPLEYMERLGWTGSDVWFAHGIHFNDEELRVLAKTGTGVAHCPISNMKLSSGIARIPEMLELGVPVGLAVDGSASNDGSSLMEELRVAFLLHRLNASRRAPTGYDVLKMATRGSARLLGRDDIGQLAVGKCADLFMIDSRRLELVGSCFDPKSVLGTVGVRGPVDYTVVHGRVTVAQGHLMTVDEERLAQDAETCCRQYLAR